MSPPAPAPAHAELWPLRFISVEAVSGVALLAAAAIALAWANSRWAGAYEGLWHLKLGLGVAEYLPARDLHFWVNDGLMSVFFLVVGLEIRREMHAGALSDPRVATLPIVAAVGGVAIPALLYVLINSDPAARRGWAIPTATDIAFAVGVLSLIGKDVPPALRLLLLTLAIIDDIAAIVIIAFFYSTGIAVVGLLVVAAGVLGVLVLQWLGVQPALAYVLPGSVVWFGMLHAGLHPALAGVLLGLLTPATSAFGRVPRGRGARRAGAPPVERVQATLHPWVAFGIMPLVRLKLCVLPAGVRWRHVLLVGLLGGIGFTMSIFIANLAFEDLPLLAAAKFAVLVASVLAATLGLLLGRLRGTSATL